ncbi:MAG: site-2 protease family protein [Frankia sp.]
MRGCMSIWWPAGAVVVYVGALILSVFVHELGHALGSVAVGYRVQSIRFGSLPPTARSTRPADNTSRGFQIRLGWGLHRGAATTVTARTGAPTPGRSAFFIAAGPMINLAFTGVLSCAGGPLRLPRSNRSRTSCSPRRSPAWRSP